MLKPVIARYQECGESIAFRGDAAFAQPSMYEYLELEGIEYAIRLPANQILQAEIAHMLKRPVWAAGALRTAFLQKLPLSGGELGAVAPGRCQGGMALR